MHCFRLLPGVQSLVMDGPEQAENPRSAQPLTIAQRANAILYSGYFYPKVHPSISAAAIATGQPKDPRN